MKASEVIKRLEEQIKYNGDLEVTCVAGDDYFRTNWVKYDSEDNEIQIEYKGYGE
jgi:hypothetical protein